jgi:hypothetical protein
LRSVLARPLVEPPVRPQMAMRSANILTFMALSLL